MEFLLACEGVHGCLIMSDPGRRIPKVCVCIWPRKVHVSRITQQETLPCSQLYTCTWMGFMTSIPLHLHWNGTSDKLLQVYPVQSNYLGLSHIKHRCTLFMGPMSHYNSMTPHDTLTKSGLNFIPYQSQTCMFSCCACICVRTPGHWALLGFGCLAAQRF